MRAPTATKPPTAERPFGSQTVAESAAADERHLVDGLLAGAPECVTEFLERTHHPVFCMACRLTSDSELRRDWAHAVVLGTLEDLRRGRFVYRRPGSLWAWFRKRAYYRLLDEYRRHRVWLARSGGLDPGDPSGDFADLAGTDDPVAEMERLEMRNAIETCLDAIDNPDHRRALSLRLFDDLPYQQVAEAMGAPLNSVRAWIRRGRLALRRCLATRLEGPGERPWR